MESIVSKGENLIFTIPKSLISEKEIQKFLDLLKFYDLCRVDYLLIHIFFEVF